MHFAVHWSAVTLCRVDQVPLPLSLGAVPLRCTNPTLPLWTTTIPIMTETADLSYCLHAKNSTIIGLRCFQKLDVTQCIISGDLTNPLVAYQQQNFVSLHMLGVPFLSTQRIMQDPASAYDFFLGTLTNELNSAQQVPPLSDLQALELVHVKRSPPG